ncbi:MAG: hypothetical protein QMD53_02220 [Actinomycetota bacterium]|nr:hypothetical protein [Actinomycetota bacterium]
MKANSVIAASVIHGSLNGSLGLSLMVIKGGNDLTVGGTGFAGFIVLGLTNLLLFTYDRYLAKESLALSKALG